MTEDVGQTRVVQMWDRLKRSDIEQLKQELQARRAAILKRHVEELDRLDADRGEIELLGRLAVAFSQKFRRPAAPPEPVVSKVVKEPAALPEPAAKRLAREPATGPNRGEEAYPRDKRHHSGTNFDMFSRAVAKSSF